VKYANLFEEEKKKSTDTFMQSDSDDEEMPPFEEVPEEGGIGIYHGDAKGSASQVINVASSIIYLLL
jgi:hypothetical protein